MNDTDRLNTAFGYAAEKTKQLITLATAILTITVSFSRDVLGGMTAWTVLPLMVGWVLYLVSIVEGVVLLGRFAGRMQAAALDSDALSSPDIISPAKWQVGSFIAGVAFTTLFGICTLTLAISKAGGLFSVLPHK